MKLEQQHAKFTDVKKFDKYYFYWHWLGENVSLRSFPEKSTHSAHGTHWNEWDVFFLSLMISVQTGASCFALTVESRWKAYINSVLNVASNYLFWLKNRQKVSFLDFFLWFSFGYWVVNILTNFLSEWQSVL